jgi:MerR HTH family regulatory protein
VERGWALEDLVRRVALALAAGDVRSANGRVTQLPDRRVIRWYATIGLVDRPLASQGRTARYGPRHLLQLVAIKRRQAEGRSLADIQVELAGAPDATLSRIARVPPELLIPVDPAVEPAPAAEPPQPELAYGEGAPEPVTLARFWARHPPSPPVGSPPVASPPVSSPPVGSSTAAPSPAVGPVPQPPLAGPATLDGVLHGVRLVDAVLLLLPAAPGPTDVVAIRAAAQPLLDLLVHRGLLPDPGGSTT